MRILLLNQTFHPDVVATAQYLTELAQELVAQGHEVQVITGRRAYDDPSKFFPARERWNGIEIRRARNTRFGKGAKWRRALDFASFIAACCWELVRVPRPDVVIALTSPPLISFIGAAYASLRRTRFVYWVMDLNPDEAIAAGWLREGSLVARVLKWMSRFSIRRADKVVVLDRFMQTLVLNAETQGREVAKAGHAQARAGQANSVAADPKVVIVPPWSQDDSVAYDEAGRREFRAANRLTDKFVVMYSGNHSPCHPLTALLEAARELRQRRDIVFAFVGGGSEFAKVKAFAAEHALPNILCLPYQPLDQLSGSLSAADLHVVVMGERMVGTIHPCKVYNIMSVGAPLLYIGPAESHVSDLLGEQTLPPHAAWQVQHRDVAATVTAIHQAAACGPQRIEYQGSFSKHECMRTLVNEVCGTRRNAEIPTAI